MCFYEDSMHVCMNICVCVYVHVIGGDMCKFICVGLSMYVCVHVCMCVLWAEKMIKLQIFCNFSIF